ncbi:peroxisomal (S)-2-hydroxy-acid oxidase GLO5-like isoform X1 [Drosophila novamexicana]|uniref:peroxisomal (S)-2-hydroxy-acid oxidase GLO5-like isoform X1 n=1 Tax=Drosophila novamexicana TaxID=47314 RepID=UPI0011E5F67C|nr:peroxisomal (S)-2-hydroxy-acid oxidase GLO5-like isoform X1 [Drosophila novamexicana]
MAFVSVSDFEQKASVELEKNALDYYKSGAGEQLTLRLNREAFQRVVRLRFNLGFWLLGLLRLRPRCLRDVSQLEISCMILGHHIEFPLGIAPVAMQKMAHPVGEIGNARAAGVAGCIFILSTLATTSLEDLAAAAPETCKWFQLYIYKDRALTESLVRRAENAGFKALVLTVDAPVFGQRRDDVRNKFSLPSHLSLANFHGELASGVVSVIGGSGLSEYVVSQFDPTVTWQDIKWLKLLTHLPIIVKGVLTAEDAELAREFGCAGIIVSNHGGRQLDSTPATIEVLPEIVKAVGKDLVVMLDGGIREGNDILKALALGAQMVFIGRPSIWALACDGLRGVEQLLGLLRKDFEISMALTGCRTLADIQATMVVPESAYRRLK